MRISAADRLNALPLVFTIDEAREAMVDLEEATLRLTLHRWAGEQRGFIQPIGPKAGVYFNVFRDPDAPAKYLAEGVMKCHQPVCLRGLSALYEHGAISKAPKCWTLAIRHTTNNYRQLYDAEMSLRPIKFFELLAERGLMPPREDGLPTLTLEAALADMQVYKDPALNSVKKLNCEVDTDLLEELTGVITLVAQRGRKPAEYISAEPSA